MKKIVSLLLALTLMAVMVGCDKHVHEFEDDWSTNEDYHWHDCTSADCDEQDGKEAHTFEETENDGTVIMVCSECGYEQESTVPEHTCSYSSDWSSNEDTHWHACTQEGCLNRGETEDHAFDAPVVEQEADLIRRTYTCAVCGYTYSQITQIESVISGDAAWESAFANLEMVNFSMDVYYGNDSSTQHNHCEVTENAAYYHIENSTEFYTVKNEDGSCTTYERYDETSAFTKLSTTSDRYLIGAQTETVIHVSFSDYFEMFTYDPEKGAYTCADQLTATSYNFDGDASFELYCYNIVIKVANGEITYIAADYSLTEVPSEDEYYRFVYYNIGLTEVQIPYDVINSAITE